MFGFHADKPALLYLRQWFVFALVALVLGIVLYVLGRTILERIWGRADGVPILVFETLGIFDGDIYGAEQYRERERIAKQVSYTKPQSG